METGHGRPAAVMAEQLAGTWTMARLALRRDRWLLIPFVIGFPTMAGSTAASAIALYPDEAGRIDAATAVNGSAALVAMFGRVYDPSSLGALSLIKLTAFGAAILAVIVVALTLRHTRTDEANGRLELAASGRLGRSAPLAAALLVVGGASIVLGVLTGLALIAGGLPAGGSLAFGLGWAATGLAFAAVAGVLAQLTASPRTALGLGIAAVATTYALRAVGDLAEPGPSMLSWLSPIGWNQQVRAFAGDRLPVLILPLLLVLVLVPAAFALRARRDLGAGLVQGRERSTTRQVRGLTGLAIGLQWRSLVAWAVGFTLFGLVIGSLADTMEDMLASAGIREVMEALGGQQALRDAMLAAYVAMLGVIAAAYGIAAASRLRSEEVDGHVECLLGAAVSRIRWAWGHLGFALAGVAALMLVGGTSIGIGAALALDDPSQVGRVATAALAQVPAAWVVTVLVVLAFGWVPRMTAAVWGVLLACVAIGEFGVLWGVPDWLMDLSPFRHAPLLPVGMDGLASILALLAVAAVIGAIGLVGWRRRDLAA